ncbi:telomeric repeat-binding factor 1-like isoform X2 [Mytilus californianus]|uniref:telomeric repeat-binding factor 1-like isoform X2 n=1 Tax=Mytilus californianus TaxID=6549 RepID=UPI002245F2A1|nr:telomeric repeat-binding factor 1-like isoform X2 [Mytilus californianus]
MAGSFEEERVNSWILDYSYQRAWKEFSSTSNIDLQTTRDFIQWIVTQPCMITTERKLKVQILLFLCRLSDGSDHTTRYSVNSNITALEEALKNIDSIEPLLGKKHVNCLEPMRTSVKKQAVLVCCRADDFEAGKDVFQRLWQKPSSKEEKNAVDNLQKVLVSNDKAHSYINFNTYERFLKKAVEYLSEIHDSFSIPYLLQQAESYEKKSHMQDLMKGTIKFSNADIQQYMTSNGIKSLTRKAQQNMETKLQRIREAKQIQEGDVEEMQISESNNNAESDETEHEENTSRLRKRTVQQTSTPKKGTPKKMDNGSNDESDSEKISPLHKRLGLEAESSILNPKKGQRIPWNYGETKDFYKQVKKHGVGNWSKIRDNLHTFRTNVQLKDKWRSILSNESLISKLYEECGKM